MVFEHDDQKPYEFIWCWWCLVFTINSMDALGLSTTLMSDYNTTVWMSITGPLVFRVYVFPAQHSRIS